MQEVIILKGIPASGKSTYAKDLIKKNPEKYKRVNNDDLRAMLDNSKWTPDNEKFIMNMRNYITLQALKDGYSVIIDNTNLHTKHENKIKDIVKNYCNIENRTVMFKIKWFHIDLKEALKRDSERIGIAQVGFTVINDMFDSYEKAKNKDDSIQLIYPDFIVHENSGEDAINQNLEKCVIVDIDGTVAKMVDRGPFEWHKVDTDEPKMPIINLVNTLAQTKRKIIFFSGRDSICRNITIKWLENYFNFPITLYMRPQNDSRKDNIVKLEMYNNNIRGKYNVDFVLDDRDQVINMWRTELGLTALQVDYGNF